MEKYLAFLRGINVGGHHKVPMAQLREEMEKLNFQHVMTLLNTGNIIYHAKSRDTARMEKVISAHLEKTFSFPIPTMVRKAQMIEALLSHDPFKNVDMSKDIRLYVSFVREDKSNVALPWTSDDGSYRILSKSDNTVLSVLDLSVSHTPKAMDALETFFGKDITTRNWNTILRIGKKLA